MASDPTKPLLRLNVGEPVRRNPGRPNPKAKPAKFSLAGQRAAFGQAWTRLERVLSRDPNALELRRDPAALAPERLLVFELRGTVDSFVRAINKIPGLEFIDEEEVKGDAKDEAPVVYLLVPDAAALRQLLSLWKDWLKGIRPKHGLTAFRDVFDTLRNLRTWGPGDRILAEDREALREELDRTGLVRIEVELVFRFSDGVAQNAEDTVRAFALAANGKVISRSRIPDIAYHALLVELPADAARHLVDVNIAGIAGLDPIMHIRPQSVATSIEVADAVEGAPIATPAAPDGSSIVALLDGFPVAAHPLLQGALNIEDVFDLDRSTPVAERRHGTAMASLIVHGDRNSIESPLKRPVHCVPLLGASEQFPDSRLIVDLVYEAVIGMVTGEDASAPDVLIVNLSLGNVRKTFHNRMSAWARLLDRLAHQYGLLFVVSAGNHTGTVNYPDFTHLSDFEGKSANERAEATIAAVNRYAADRRLLSPSETINGLTIGASNIDLVSDNDRKLARGRVDPLHPLTTSNPSSALGPGFANSVKPDLLLPGSREHLRLNRSGPPLLLEPSGAARAHGLKVAAPPHDGMERQEHYTCGTSAATAIASRTAHLVHDALEQEYGEDFTSLSKAERAVLLKALLVHTARWPIETADLIKRVLGPDDNSKHMQQKDNIRRFIGYGIADPDEAIACASDRATFWCVGKLGRDLRRLIKVPVPRCVNGLARPHALSATLAWFTPVMPGRQIYRSVRLTVCEPDEEITALRITGARTQPDIHQSRRGTVCSRRWDGDAAPIIGDEHEITLEVQREPDQGPAIDEDVPFGLAITFTMPGVAEIYEQVRARLIVPDRVPIR
jgi:hypothetical protein